MPFLNDVIIDRFEDLNLSVNDLALNSISETKSKAFIIDIHQ